MPYTDEQLMTQIQGNVEASMADLVQRYQGKLYNYFLRMSGDAEVAKDLVQVTFIRLYEYRDRYQADRPLMAWLFGIARNVWNTAYQKSSRRKEVVTGEPLPPFQGSFDGEQAFETQDLVASALLELSEKDRELVVLFHLKGFSYQEMGQLFGQSPGTLRVAVCRALKKLGIILKRLGYEHA